MFPTNYLSAFFTTLVLLCLCAGCNQQQNEAAVFDTNSAAKFNTSASENTTKWSDSELATLRSISLLALGEQAHNASNRYYRHPQAIAFGKQLFFDPQFSLDQSLSCASCHQPEKAFTDGLPRAQGINATGRNTPTLFGAAWQSWQYWDGRKDTLWAQALVPFEAADEMASSRLEVLRIIGSDTAYQQQYETLFGRFPRALLSPSLPIKAGPLGETSTQENWHRLSRQQQQQINRAYANVGKAIAAYERTLIPQSSRFDRFVQALLNHQTQDANKLLSEEEQAGIKLFIDQDKTQCLRCHNGPLLSNGDFHNINSANVTGAQLDFGRVFGIKAALIDEFNCQGPHSDAKPEQCYHLRFLPRDTHQLEGAFKTPTLRQIEQTSPYMHDGSLTSLSDVVELSLLP